jgi:DNA-binding response OmpR family regulator
MAEGRATILVADDDPDILEFVAFRLERDGHEVIRAHDGEQALAAARRRRPDLAVLDVTMPGLGGFEVLRALREEAPPARLPVILLSARVQEADVRRGLEAGADGYLGKPFSAQELRERVEAILAGPSQGT